MPFQNRIIQNAQAFDFTVNPIQKSITSGSSSTTYNATSFGDIIGTTGFRLWNGAPTGNVIVTPSNPWIAPLSNANLPTTLFDAIIVLSLDINEYVLAYSNSPDNYTYPAGNNLVSNDNLYWINLLKLRANNSVSSSQSPINFFFGANSLQYSLGANPGVLKLNLLNPVTANTTFTYVMQYVSTNGQSFAPSSGSITVTPTTPLRNITLGDFPTGFFINPQGHMKISVTCSDPNYRSALPFYHWGLTT